MPTTENIEHDPFAPQLAAVDHDPFAPRLLAVDHNPFFPGGLREPTEEERAKYERQFNYDRKYLELPASSNIDDRRNENFSLLDRVASHASAWGYNNLQNLEELRDYPFGRTDFSEYENPLSLAAGLNNIGRRSP